MKYIVINLEIKNGEYEFTSSTSHALPKKTNLKKFTKDWVKDFYGKNSGKEGDYYLFHGGEIAVRLDGVREITKEQYEFLQTISI